MLALTPADFGRPIYVEEIVRCHPELKFPYAGVKESIAGPYSINDQVEGTRLPRVS
jgi:hypothetical protein